MTQELKGLGGLRNRKEEKMRMLLMILPGLGWGILLTIVFGSLGIKNCVATWQYWVVGVYGAAVFMGVGMWIK